MFSYTGPALEGGITIRNPDGTVESVLPAGSTIVRFAKSVAQTGLFKFILETEQNTGNYTIELNQGSFTDLIAGTFNTVQTGTISPLYNVDRFSYHLEAGEVITIYASLFGIGQGELHS